MLGKRKRNLIYDDTALLGFALKIYYFHFADYSDTKVMRILNSELADTLGNLLSRGCAKSVNVQQVFPALDVAYFHDDLMKLDVTKKLVELIAQLPGK